MKSTDSPWYVKAFGSLYSLIYAHRTDQAAAGEVAFVLRYVEIAPGERILDLACGNGRHVRALTDSGHPVVGMDLSRDLLEEAGNSGWFVRGDMRAIPFETESFGAVLSFFTSFGYFKEKSEDLRVLKEVHRVLCPGGWFLLDFLRADAVANDLVPRSERTVRDLHITEERWLDAGRVHKRVRVFRTAEEPLLDYEEAVRLYDRDQIDGMARSSGLEPVAWYGDFTGATLEEGSRLILVARRLS